MKHNITASNLIRSAFQLDGITLSADGFIARRGIAVGGASGEWTINAENSAVSIETFIKRFIKMTAHDQKSGYGLWYDKTNGQLVLERVDILPSTQVIPALLLGRERHQNYIYIIDLDQMLEV